MAQCQCPALLIAAPASGQGKTTLTAALARYHRNQGRRVRVFKTGPDFIDPMVLQAASGYPVYNLDLWIVGEQRCRQLLADAAQKADLILIEGVMGLFDGTPSSADLAEKFNIPALVLVDAGAMAQSFGAIALGLASYRPGLDIFGLIANRVAGPRHHQMLEESIPKPIRFIGSLPRENGIILPERHLGIVQGMEIADLEQRLERAAQLIEQQGLTELPPPTDFDRPAENTYSPLLRGQTIAVARDTAFAFVYQDNLNLLKDLGAELRFFSPLQDTCLPPADSLYLPGGYPELHAEQLGSNHAMLNAVRDHHSQGKPIVAECGGMMYLAEQIVTKERKRWPMAGILPGEAVMQTSLAGIGSQYARFGSGTLRGHTFHYSLLHTSLSSALSTRRHPGGDPGRETGEAVYRQGNLTASYVHWYFDSDPSVCAALFLPSESTPDA